MSDFDKLTAALRDVPEPDADARARALALAQENFARHQGSRAAMRQMEDQQANAGPIERIKTMFATSLRPALYVTSSLVVVGLGVVITQPNWGPPGPLELAEANLPAPELGGSVAMDDEIVGVLTERSEGERQLAQEVDTEIASAPARPRRLQAAPTSEVLADRAAPAMEPAPVAGLIAPAAEPILIPESNDRFANAETNPLKITAEEPVSTFSIDVDTASYAVVRRWLQGGTLPPAQAVRIEEMVNYFDYIYPQPDRDMPFATRVNLIETPWNPDTQLLHVAIQGRQITERPPLDLVFLVDTSGSMHSPDKLPLLQQSLRMLLNTLNPDDTVALVTYAGSAGVALEPTPVSERASIETALNSLMAGGSTAGAAGLTTAYNLAAQSDDAERLSRVILATDGDFNVGLSSPDALRDFIAARRDGGTTLSVLGFGRGNLNDALMQSLAQNGNGQAAYIDTALEAQRVLVDDIQSMVPIAGDVKIQIEFNPAEIAEYRLIGYETRALAREDFNNDRVDAGDIGAGHSVTALYELTPVDSPARLTDPLRYGTASETQDGETGFLRLRFKRPGETESQLIEQVLPAAVTAPDSEVAFAAAIAGFGQLLRANAALGDWSWDQAITLAQTHKGFDPEGARAEAIALMRLAQSLAR